jgi:hypothetical protein
MKGYTEQDICEINNWDITSVKSCFNTACKKIKEQNDIDWLEWIEISGNVKIPDDVKYKRCTVCGKDLRANEDNFGKHPNTKDNLQSVCKKCDSLRKSSNNTNI